MNKLAVFSLLSQKHSLSNILQKCKKASFAGQHLSFRCLNNTSKDKFGDEDLAVFNPRRAVILSRITRYEFEKLWYKDSTEEQFKSKVICFDLSVLIKCWSYA